MEFDYWHKQTADKPLFGDLLWSRPENKSSAGKLLIIGGNVHAFNEVALAYLGANKAGAGTIRILLPDTLKKTVGKSLENTQFCPSTPSGSFSKSALAEFIDNAQWGDMVLLAGNFGRNSETAILLESFMKDYKDKLCLVNDALDYFMPTPANILNRPETLLVATIAELQKLSIKLIPEKVIKFDMSLMQLVEAMHEFSKLTPAFIVTKHLDNILVAVNGKISTTKISEKFDPWRVNVSASASVWWLQNPTKPFEALTTSTYMDQ